MPDAGKDGAVESLLAKRRMEARRMEAAVRLTAEPRFFLARDELSNRWYVIPCEKRQAWEEALQRAATGRERCPRWAVCLGRDPRITFEQWREE
jgi:hypothetical protein